MFLGDQEGCGGRREDFTQSQPRCGNARPRKADVTPPQARGALWEHFGLGRAWADFTPALKAGQCPAASLSGAWALALEGDGPNAARGEPLLSRLPVTLSRFISTRFHCSKSFNGRRVI